MEAGNSQTDTAQVRVLIVEDDFINALILKKYLEKQFFVKQVTNGHDAIKLTEQEIFDIILMDINLGDDTLDGIETTRRIRKTIPSEKTKIVAVTAYTGEDLRQTLRIAGFNDYQTKPIDKEGILTIIRKYF